MPTPNSHALNTKLKTSFKEILWSKERAIFFSCLEQLSQRRKQKIYLVGGALRDFLIGKECVDFDFAVATKSVELARLFARKVKGAFVLLDKQRGCARVVKKTPLGSMTFDFADFRAKGIKGDLAARDFTLNSLCIELGALGDKIPLSKSLIFAPKGLYDLKRGCIRMTSSKIFQEDPLRLLRAFSLRAQMGFSIERKTLERIKKEAKIIYEVSPERIRDEFFKILTSSSASLILKEMDKVGLLKAVIPQLTVMDKVKQGGYHHLDVWPHSLETVVQLEKVFDEYKRHQDVQQYLNEPFAGSRRRLENIKLAALLHDIGKPDAKRKEKGRMTFHGHEHIGRIIVRKIAMMLRLSTRERHAIEDMVTMHLRPGYLSNFKRPSERAIFRFFRDARDETVAILLLSLADQRSTRGPKTTEADQKHHKKICKMLIRKYFTKKKERPFVRLIDGNDLIKQLRLVPSALFTKILRAVEEQQALGVITTKKEALTLAKMVSQKEFSKTHHD